MNPKKRIGDAEASTLANICRVAAERFEENAKGLRKLAEVQTPPEGALYPTGDGARRLAEQFDRQAREAHDFAAVFDNADEFHIPLNDDEVQAA